MKTILRLLAFLKPFTGWIVLSASLGTATVVSAIGLMGTSAYIISMAALHPSVAVLQVAIVGVRFFGISRGVFRYLERLASHSVNIRLLAHLRVWFYRSIEPLAPARLMDYRSGDLLGRVVTDIDTLENFYVRVVSPLVVAGVATAGMGLFVGQWGTRLGGLLVGGMLLAGVAVPCLAYLFSRRPAARVVGARAALRTAVVEGVQGLEDLTAFGRASAWLEDVDILARAQSKAQTSLAVRSGMVAALNLLAANLTVWAVLGVAIPLVSGGSLDGVLLAVVALLALASFEAVLPLGTAAQHLESSLHSARRLFALADSHPAVTAPVQPASAPRTARLEVRNLTFSYAEDLPPALLDVSFSLEAGRHIAVVGPSGSGKSTLLNLLQRFWDCLPGSILLDGRDIRAYQPQDVRRVMGVVGQNSHIFGDSLRQNLLMAQPGADDATLMHALERVNLLGWFKTLPDGLDTWLGERGQNLSGGEGQRLAVARVLLMDRPLLLLDEPTANLDAVTERELLEVLNTASAGRSILWVTHRLAGLETMDEIIVLAGGRVVEQGSQAQLLAEGGMFARMWNLQTRVVMESQELSR